MCSFIDSIRQLIADVCSAFLKNLRFHFILNFAGAGSSGLLESASVNIVVHALFVLIVQQQCCRGLLREACPQSCHDSLFVPVFYFIKCIFMVLKMQILYLKLQTKDHFWSPTHSEVVLLYYIYIYYILLYCDLATRSKLSSLLQEYAHFFLADNVLLSCRIPVKLGC